MTQENVSAFLVSDHNLQIFRASCSILMKTLAEECKSCNSHHLPMTHPKILLVLHFQKPLRHWTPSVQIGMHLSWHSDVTCLICTQLPVGLGDGKTDLRVWGTLRGRGLHLCVVRLQQLYNWQRGQVLQAVGSTWRQAKANVFWAYSWRELCLCKLSDCCHTVPFGFAYQQHCT
jgi:hypothetical protein